MADCIVLNRNNTDLLAANTRKKQQAQRTGTQYDGQGARVLSLKDVEKRRRLAETRKRRTRLSHKQRKKNKMINCFFWYLKT